MSPSRQLTTLEKAELLLILLSMASLVVVTEFLSIFSFPASALLGHIVLWLCGLLLFQGLIRDLWLLRTSKAQSNAKKTAKMMCIESSIGLLGILVGLLLSLYFSSLTIALVNWVWIALIAMILVFGFFLKDYVFAFNPLRIAREPDHLNVVVKFW